MNQRHLKLLGPAFVAFEAVMHVYIAVYLIMQQSNIPVIAFTLFEMVMFFYLLVENRMRKNASIAREPSNGVDS